MTPAHMDALTVVTLGIFIVGLVFASGVNHQRISSLEEGRKELREDMAAMKRQLDDIERLIREGT